MAVAVGVITQGQAECVTVLHTGLRAASGPKAVRTMLESTDAKVSTVHGPLAPCFQLLPRV
jgi:hypothetical protein